jgi:hypothetical protein
VDLVAELSQAHNLVYLVPIALAGMLTILRRVGFEVDFLAAVDMEPGDQERRRAAPLRRFLARMFPAGELNILRTALFGVGWASTGLVLNHVFHNVAAPYLHVTIFIVACGAGVVSATVGGRLFHFFLPSEDHATSLVDFVGATAVVISEVVDEAHGRARVQDDAGSTITVFCRHLGDGEHPRLGTTVTLVGYDAEARVFDAMP